MQNDGNLSLTATLISDGQPLSVSLGASSVRGSANLLALKQCCMKQNPIIRIQVTEFYPDGGTTTLLTLTARSATIVSPAAIPSGPKGITQIREQLSKSQKPTQIYTDLKDQLEKESKLSPNDQS